MEIHYFQRYHQGENVHTANAMLLLSRLFDYSPQKYYKFMGEIIGNDAEIKMIIQDGGKGSIPDATIYQPSYRVEIETKNGDSFEKSQLVSHLNKFQNEDSQVLLTLCPIEEPTTLRKMDIVKDIDNFNKEYKKKISHCHFTYSKIIEIISALLFDRDVEMADILNDYKNYCVNSGLIKHIQLKVHPVEEKEQEILKRLNLYHYQDYRPNLMEYKFFGLYKNKKVNAVGEIKCRIIHNPKTKKFFTEDTNSERYYNSNKCDIEDRIQGAVKEFNLTASHRFFIVEKFEPTDITKTSLYPIQGQGKVFDLTEMIGATKETTCREVAEKMKGKTWE